MIAGVFGQVTEPAWLPLTSGNARVGLSYDPREQIGRFARCHEMSVGQGGALGATLTMRPARPMRPARRGGIEPRGPGRARLTLGDVAGLDGATGDPLDGAGEAAELGEAIGDDGAVGDVGLGGRTR